MPKLQQTVPRYRKHRASGQAVVTIQGRDHYLGPWKSKASRVQYDRLISEWLAAGRPTVPSPASTELTVIELMAAYWKKFVRIHYVKNRRPTSEQACIKNALRPVKQLYSHTPACEFGPLALKAVRQRLIDHGLARSTINLNVGRVRRMFKWGASEQLIPAATYEALATVTGLQRGRSQARETEPIRPVKDQHVEAVLDMLSSVVADMVRLQRLTGARPSEICRLRPCDINTSEAVWKYRPASHKTQHHGHEREIYIGPAAQSVLTPYLLRDKTSYCFSPVQSEH